MSTKRWPSVLGEERVSESSCCDDSFLENSNGVDRCRNALQCWSWNIGKAVTQRHEKLVTVLHMHVWEEPIDGPNSSENSDPIYINPYVYKLHVNNRFIYTSYM
jgi:hypothetical protein